MYSGAPGTLRGRAGNPSDRPTVERYRPVSLDGTEIKHFIGVSAFSEYTVIMEKALVKVPEGFPLEQAALLGCAVITGMGAVTNAARVKPGSCVAVFGSGGVGLNVVQGAALAGAEKIIAVDLLDNKLDLAPAVWSHPHGQRVIG